MKLMLPKYLFFLLAIGLFYSCYKKDKRSIAGIYTGEERHIRIGTYLDTQRIDTSDRRIEIVLKNNRTFQVIKDNYPYYYEISANDLVKEGNVVKAKGFLTKTRWVIQVDGNTLTARFEENDLGGGGDHYLFTGTK